MQDSGCGASKAQVGQQSTMRTGAVLPWSVPLALVHRSARKGFSANFTCRYGVLGRCASPCNPSYLTSLVITAGLTSPALSNGVGAMTDQTHERSLDGLARELASGNLSRRKVLYSTGGYREVYDRLQRNTEESGAE